MVNIILGSIGNADNRFRNTEQPLLLYLFYSISLKAKTGGSGTPEMIKVVQIFSLFFTTPRYDTLETEQFLKVSLNLCKFLQMFPNFPFKSTKCCPKIEGVGAQCNLLTPPPFSPLSCLG